MYIVKDTPIFSNKTLYKVGDKFPYSDSEKHLLWNLEEIKETPNLSAKSSKADEIVSETVTEETTKANETVINVKRALPIVKAKKKKTISKNIKRK